jgi:RNA polymerase sigma-70 factor (ECF subfamily)
MTNDVSNDSELMARLAKGDMAALSDIVRRNQDKVLSLSYRILKDWHKAEDIAQETFLRVYRAANHYKPKAKFTTWLYRIVVNLCLDEQRKKAHAEASLFDVAPVDLTESNYETVERKEILDSVKNAINELPERQRLTLILHRYDGLSHSEIAEVTRWTKSAVESLLVRAYANLREKLNKIKYFDE